MNEVIDNEARTRVTVVENAVEKIERSVSRIADSMGQIVALEAKHADTREAVNRAFLTIDKHVGLDQVEHLAISKRISDVDARVQRVEVMLPSLQEARGWMVKAMMLVLTVVIGAIIALVVKQ